MATLYDLAMQYLNQSLPKTFKYDRTNQPGTNPPILPVQPTEPIKKILPVQGGGDGFSVYNPDPNRTRNESNYSPYAMRQAYSQPDSDVGIPSGILSDSSFLYGEKPTGIAGAIATYAKNSLPGRIIGGVANFANDMLPFNIRAALENELLGQGVMLDDIGRVVSNDYNTAEGIMSGYNANKITDETFEKRTENISNTLKDKYGFTQEEIDEAIAGTYTGTKGFNPTMGKTTNLIGNLNDLFNAKNIFNRQNIVADAIEQNELRKEEEATEIQRQKDIQDAINKEKSKKSL